MSPEECEQVGEGSEKKSESSRILQVNLSLLAAILSDMGQDRKRARYLFQENTLTAENRL